MPARLGDTVMIHYRLRAGGRDIVDTFADTPETFTLGHGEIDPRIETLLRALEVGERRVLLLDPDQAFGRRDESLLQTLSHAEFTVGEPPIPGHGVEFPLPNGETLIGTVVAVAADTVTVDFNHPLAGLAVELDIELLDIQGG